MIALLLTFLSPDHPICGQLLGLIHFLQSWRLILTCRTCQEPLFLSQFIYRLHQEMNISFQSLLAPDNEAVILTNIGDLRYALASPIPLIVLAMSPTQPSPRAPIGHRGGGIGGIGGIGGSSGSGRNSGDRSGSGGRRDGLLRRVGTTRAKHSMYPYQKLLLPTNYSLC